jgi:hypothetical protein
MIYAHSYHSEDLGTDGKITLELNHRETRWESVDYIHLAQDKDQWLALVNTVMSLRISKKVGNLTS